MDDAELKRHIFKMINDDGIFTQIAKEAFNSVDKDSSGSIDKAEFKECALQVAKGFGLENPEDESIEEIYRKLDSDNNGDIDFVEFKKYVKEIIFKILEEM